MIKYLFFVGGLLFALGIQAQCPALSPATLPFTEDFESYTGTVEPSANDSVFNCSSTYKWDFHRAGSSGRLSFATTAYSGSQSAVMDATSGYDTNFTTLTVNLSTYTASSNSIILSFYYRENSDETDPVDKVWLRGSSTDSYIEILDWNAAGSGSTWALARLKLDSILAANSQSFSSTTQIRWGQNDNSTWTGGDGFAFDDVSIVELTCPQPSGLTATLTGTSIDVNWTTGGASSWQVSYGPTGSSPGQNITGVTGSLPFTITGLSSGGTYDVYVRDSCAAGDVSFWTGPVSVSVPYVPPYLEDWSNGFPNGWTEAQGLISDSTVFTSTSSSSWTSGSFNSSGSAAARINIWSTGPDEWLISPSIDLGTGTTYQLNFQAGLTAYASTSGATLGVDDTVKVVISTDNGITWSDTNTLLALSSADAIANGSGSYYAVSLAGYSGVVKIAFYAESTVSNADNDFYVDDIEIRIPPACPKPISLVSSNITKTSIDLTWQTGGSGPWYIHWGPCGFNQGSVTHVDTATTNPYTLTGLNPGTSYEYRLIEQCGSDLSDTVNGGCFNTLCDALALPFIEGFNSTSGTEMCWTVRDDNSDGDMWDMNYGSNEYEGDGVAVMYTDGNSGSNDDWLISPALALSGNDRLIFQYRVQSSGEPNDFELLLSTTGTNPSDFTDTLMPLSSFSNNIYQEMNVNLSAFSDTVYIAWHVPQGGLDGWRLYIDKVVVENIPPCLTPTAFQASSVGSDSIQVSWNSDGSVISHGIEYGPVGFTPGTGTLGNPTDTFLVVNALTANTVYDFYLTDTCAAGASMTVGPLTISTLCNAPSPVTLPWVEDFESYSGMYRDFVNFCHTDYNLTYSNTDTVARLRMNTGAGYPNGGTVAATLDRDPSGGVESNFLTFTLDLSNYTTSPGILLEFYYQHHGEENHANDRVWVRGSDTSAWVEAYNLYANQGPTSTYNHVSVDILTILTASGQNVSPTTQIRFGQQDDFPSTSLTASDGYTFDDISLSELTCGLASNLDTGLVMPNSAVLKWTSNGSLWNIEWGPQGFGQGSQSAGGYMIKGVSTNPYTLANLGADSCYDFYVQDTCIGVGAGAWAGPFSFCTPPTCPAPTNLGVVSTSLTLNSADVYWTPGLATNFNIEYGIAGFAQGTGGRMQSTNDTATISGLSPGTEYEFYVRDSCSATDTSRWEGPFSFVTPFSTNYLEDFTMSSPLGWTEAYGRLTSNTVFTSTTSSSWGSGIFANVGSNNAQLVNIYSDDEYEWLISPSIYLDPAITNLQVELDVAVTEWWDVVQGYLGADDTLALVISTDNGATWSSSNIMWYADASDTLDVAGEHIILPLTGYSGYVKFGIYAGSANDDPEDNELFVDNFEVRTPRACPFPTGLTVSDIGTDSALVSWTEGSPGFINAEVIYTVGNQPASAGTIVNSTNDSIVITGLTGATEYCVYVVEECVNGFSDTIGPVCFTTACLPFTAPYFEDFEGATASCWSNALVTGTKEWTIATGSSGGTVNSAYSGNLNARFTSSSGGPHITKYVSPIIDVSSLASAELTFWYAQEDWAGDQNYLNVYYRDNAQAAWVHIWGDSTNVTAWTQGVVTIPSNSSTLEIAFEGVDLYGRANVIDDVSINVAGATTCPSPSGLAVANISCDSVELSWISDTANTPSVLEYGPKGYTPGSGTLVTGISSPYILSGLSYNTEYDFYVADSCGVTLTTISGPFTFKTDSVGSVMASFIYIQSDTTLNDATVDFDASASTGDGLTYDWDFGNGSTGTGMNATGTYTANGTVSVKLTITDRCGNTDDTTITVVVSHISISENLYNVGIDVYPNPSNGNFKVNISGENSAYAIEVTDLSGKVVYKNANLKGGEEQEVNLGNVASGVYLIRISGNGLNATQRIMID